MARAIWSVLWFLLLNFGILMTLGAYGASTGNPEALGAAWADAFTYNGILGFLLLFVVLVGTPVALGYASWRLGQWTAYFFRRT